MTKFAAPPTKFRAFGYLPQILQNITQKMVNITKICPISKKFHAF